MNSGQVITGAARAVGPGRNDPCPCGSGKKYKQCCGRTGAVPSGARADAAPAVLNPLAMSGGPTLTEAGKLSGHFSPLQRVLRLGPADKPEPEPRIDAKAAGGEGSAAAYVTLARGYVGARRVGDAIQTYRQATRLDPANHAIWYELADVLFQLGRMPEAIGALRRAVSAKPDFAAGHHLLGKALEQQGNEIQAIGALRRAVDLAPSLTEAHARLGTLFMALSRRPEGIAAYRRAAETAPQSEMGRLALAKALMAEEKQAEAEAVLRRMLARNPKHFDARKMLGDVLSFSGRFEESGKEYQRAISIGRQPVPAYHSLVMSRKMTEADRPVVEGMQRLLKAGGLNEFGLVLLHFALGKALDDQKEYEAAMQHFDAANLIRHRTVNLDRKKIGEQVDQIIERFTPTYFARFESLGSPDETPLLVLGMPRSGTTLTEQIVSSHPSVVGGGELPFWLENGPVWEEARPGSVSGEWFDRLGREYLAILRDIGPDARRVTDKMPPNFMWIGLIHMVFPRARIIHCKRNPIDTCLSIYSTYFSARTEFATDRGDLVFFYRQYERLMAHWRKVLPASVFHETQYEELVADRETRSRELIAFCGLEWDDACLVPEQNERAVRTASVWQARQPVYRTPVERWRRYEPWLGELRELLG
jgi:tetratricopeptide (TPR) repeat protein